MTSMASKVVNSSCGIQVLPVQEKGSRNKRKFRADPPLSDPSKILPSGPNECTGYELSAEKFEIASGHGSSDACDLASFNQNHSDGLKLDLWLPSSMGSSEVWTGQPREDVEPEESHDADWSDLTESQLEELVLSNLDAIFKSAIKKIVACGYTEEVARKAVLRSGLCYGCKDTVSNIVDNTLAFLKNGQEIDPSKEHCFDDLQQLEKYILAELVCVLREVRPFFSTGDAMWCLLMCDMNVSHACAMDGDPLNSFSAEAIPNGTSTSIQSQPQLKLEAKGPEVSLPNPSKPLASCSCPSNSKPEVTTTSGVSNTIKPKNSAPSGRHNTEKEEVSSAFEPVNKTFTIGGSSPALDDKFAASRKVHSISAKKECLLRKSIHTEKSYRTYISKGLRTGKLNGLILDKKMKSVSESTTVNIKNASLRLSKAMGVNVAEDNRTPVSNPVSSAISSNSEGAEAVPSLHKTTPSAATPVNTLPALSVLNTSTSLSVADTELSLSLPAKSNPISTPVSCNVETSNYCFGGMPNEKSMAQWVSGDKKDEMIMGMLSRVQELQNQLQEWTEWANQKVMQAARRLGKDKAELKSLRQEKEEVERLKKEKQTLEENTMKKLTEMENALCKASGQVERANAAVRRLEVENTALRKEMEAAKLRAAESAASCKEVEKREKKTMMKFQSWEKQKTMLKEDLVSEKGKVANMLLELEQAKQLQEQQEARWKQEEKAKEQLLMQVSSIRKEREQIEASAKAKEDSINSKAATNLQKYKDDIQKLEKEISQLRLKTDSSKIAALRWGVDGSYASRLTDQKTLPWTPYMSEGITDIHNTSTGDVKRERECVMCLSEEMSVVFLPCAHQVVCTTCNELHEKQGMKDCPSCRSTIQRRIPVRYLSS